MKIKIIGILALLCVALLTGSAFAAPCVSTDGTCNKGFVNNTNKSQEHGVFEPCRAWLHVCFTNGYSAMEAEVGDPPTLSVCYNACADAVTGVTNSNCDLGDYGNPDPTNNECDSRCYGWANDTTCDGPGGGN